MKDADKNITFPDCPVHGMGGVNPAYVGNRPEREAGGWRERLSERAVDADKIVTGYVVQYPDAIAVCESLIDEAVRAIDASFTDGIPKECAYREPCWNVTTLRLPICASCQRNKTIAAIQSLKQRP